MKMRYTEDLKKKKKGERARNRKTLKKNQLASSPTKRLPSELAEAITGSNGWKLTSLTEPEWPGRAYSSAAVFESQTYAVPGFGWVFFF